MDVRDFLPPNMRNRAMEFFTYGVDTLPLGALARVSSNITVQNDADFVLMGARARVDDPAAGVAVAIADPPITVQVSNTGTQQLQSQPVPLATFFATGTAPGAASGIGGNLPVPYVFKAGSTIGTTLVSLDAALTYDVRLAYIGIKVYYFEWNV